MYRTTKNEKKYRKERPQQKKCPFCQPDKKEVRGQTVSFYILENIYGYDLWDMRRVKQHLMIVSKTHTANFGKLNSKVAHEYLKLLNKYLKLGFDIFTRSTLSITKTQPHFHTHLIKTEPKLAKKINFTTDPYQLKFK